MPKETTSPPGRAKQTRKKKTAAKTRQVNPVRVKLDYVQECLAQLQSGLPETESAYVAADSLTHAYVKSCVLMSLQRIVDINNAVIGFSFRDETPPAHKHHSFIIMERHGAIEAETQAFFQAAMNCYQTLANPYEELPPPEMYRLSRGLMKHGAAYIQQIETFFAGKRAKSAG